MQERLWIIVAAVALLGLVYWLCMRATPRRGVMRVVERVCAGAAIMYVCCAALELAGVTVTQGPLSAVSAGYLGLPGAALAVLAQLWR